MAIDNGTMIPLARMERGCPQSGRGRGREIVSCEGYIHGMLNGVLMHRQNNDRIYKKFKNAGLIFSTQIVKIPQICIVMTMP